MHFVWACKMILLYEVLKVTVIKIITTFFFFLNFFERMIERRRQIVAKIHVHRIKCQSPKMFSFLFSWNKQMIKGCCHQQQENLHFVRNIIYICTLFQQCAKAPCWQYTVLLDCVECMCVSVLKMMRQTASNMT